MASLAGKVALVIGNGTPEHRSVAVALGEAGADVAIAGNTGTAEVLLHSIANEIWALGRRTMVAGIVGPAAASFAAVAGRATEELGRVDFVVRVDAVLEA